MTKIKTEKTLVQIPLDEYAQMVEKLDHLEKENKRLVSIPKATDIQMKIELHLNEMKQDYSRMLTTSNKQWASINTLIDLLKEAMNLFKKIKAIKWFI